MITTLHADYRYLSIQVGELYEWKDDGSWHARYVRHLIERMAKIAPALPQSASSYCDIGGGLCGIGILLNQHFGGELHVNVIDGDGPPIMRTHAQPFSSHEQTLSFLRQNGVRKCDVWSPDDRPQIKFDLITSFRAWCFHFPPLVYLEWVMEHLEPSGRLIVDVRNDKPAYLTTLHQVFMRSKKVADYGKGALWQFQL